MYTTAIECPGAMYYPNLRFDQGWAGRCSVQITGKLETPGRLWKPEG